LAEVPIPGVGFTLSLYTLDSRNNQLMGNSEGRDGVHYSWDMGDGLTETGATIQHNYQIAGNELAYTITLTATSLYGCTDTVSVIVDVVPFVPNVFTPNGDGINDIFMEDLDLEVFDRNGLSLYKGTAGWNGTYKGKPADPDTYFYSLSYPDRHQQNHTRKGFITLLR